MLGVLAAEAQLTDWKRVPVESRMGEAPMIAFYAQASERFVDGARKGKPMLMIGCGPNRARFAIMAEVQIQPETGGAYGQRSARIRLDDGKPIRIVGQESNAGSDIYVPDGAAWIKRLASAKIAMVEVTPFRHGPTAIPFAVAGLDVHAKEIEQYCGVKLKAK